MFTKLRFILTLANFKPANYLGLLEREIVDKNKIA